ncbi:hypothetical protein HK096_009932 [Nowakowskiella sp. JEL0078]|nr:hypothetical protein HK096_009932 [Nowakowskiella sp. JEL0078]
MTSIPRVTLNFVGFPSPGMNIDPKSPSLPPAPVRRIIAELPGKSNSATITDYLQTVKKDHLSNDIYLDISKVAIYTSDFAILPKNSPVGILRDGDMVIIAFHGGSLISSSKPNPSILEPKIQTNPIPVKINEKDAKRSDKDKSDKLQTDLKDYSKNRDYREDKKDFGYERDQEESRPKTPISRNDEKSQSPSPSHRGDQERRLNISKNESHNEEISLSPHRNDLEKRISLSKIDQVNSVPLRQPHLLESETRYKNIDDFDQDDDEAPRYENKLWTRENILKEDFTSDDDLNVAYDKGDSTRLTIPQTTVPYTPATPNEFEFHENLSTVNRISDRSKDENLKQTNRPSSGSYVKRDGAPKDGIDR